MSFSMSWWVLIVRFLERWPTLSCLIFLKNFKRHFVTSKGSLILDLYRQHLKWPVFATQKRATIWLQMKLTITEYSLTTSVQLDYNIQKERTLYLVLRLRGETERQDARHQWQRDHQDPEHLPTQRTWNSTLDMMHAWSHVRIVQ